MHIASPAWKKRSRPWTHIHRLILFDSAEHEGQRRHRDGAIKTYKQSLICRKSAPKARYCEPEQIFALSSADLDCRSSETGYGAGRI